MTGCKCESLCFLCAAAEARKRIVRASIPAHPSRRTTVNIYGGEPARKERS